MRDPKIIKEIIPVKVSFERLDNAKWYQKFIAKISNRYKCSFMDVTPLRFVYEDYSIYSKCPNCIDHEQVNAQDDRTF